LFAQSVWSLYNTSNSPLLDNSVTVLEKDNNGAIWVGCTWGLFLYENGNWVDFTDSVPNPQIRSVEVDVYNNVWVGTLNGLAMYNGSWNSFNNDSLSSFTINDIESDSSGVWLGTINGLYLFSNSVLSLILDNSSLEPFLNVSSLSYIGDSLCIGTINGGLGYLYNNTVNWTNISSGMLDNTVVDIAVDETGIWCASPYGGVQRHFNNGDWYFYTPNLFLGWPSPDILSLFITENSSLLVGSNEGGLIEFDKVNNSIIYNITTNNSGLVDNKINDLLIDNEGLYWIGTENGLNTWNGVLSSIESTDYNQPFNLNNNQLLLSSPENIRIYTINGQKLIDKEKTKQVNISGFSTGVYFVQINNITYKVVIY
tara:strand:- start:3182 stop:4288 length:1107 start_codon:yes stop_codon:yes gene_type:complete